MTETVAAGCRRLVTTSLTRFVHCSDRAIAAERDDALHEARIAGKQLRYTIEFFGGVMGREHETALRLLALAQDRLGAVADARAFAGVYARLAEHLDTDDERMPGIRARIAACDAQRRDAIEAVRTLWRGGVFPPYAEMLSACITAALRRLPMDER